MASARKKLDEKNLKILRELVSKAENKYCFDCHQRGPTYVNVTIGSFVCTSCSGMLRGLTPPHRVKSISMATFTPEEIEQLKSQGNEYCRKVWLGLCDNDISVISPKDEQQIKEFMINKYERKRYYLKPDENNIAVNGTSKSTPINNQKLTSSVTFPTIPSYNSATNNISSNNRNSSAFSSDSFSSNKEVNSTLDSFNLDKFNGEDTNSSTIANFANFDNNPVFSSPTSNTFSGAIKTSENIPPPPSEDRYAALKDLDCLMKSQLLASTTPSTDQVAETSSKTEWNENSVIWPSSSSSVFEQTSSESEEISEKTLNPFARSENGWNGTFVGNPFKAENIWNCHANGLPTSQSMNYISSGPVWDTSQLRNPFFLSNNGQNSTHHSSNPFL